jgi:antimicrobial peptide system SdpB family protein
MLTSIGRIARRWAIEIDPWTNVYGVARTLMAGATALTLALNGTSTLFRPLAGNPASPPFCQVFLQKTDIFCLMPHHLDVARWIAVSILLVVASGWRPRITGVLHWWVSMALQISASTVDGGDQCASVLTLLIVPITLMDDREWHWSARKPGKVGGWEEIKRLVAISTSVAVRLQVAGIYYHAAVGKLRVTEWSDGTAIYYWLTHPLFGLNKVFEPMVRPLLVSPIAVPMLTWGVIILELFLMMGIVATERVKKILLAAGILLHSAIMLFQGLGSFSLTMFGALILFLRPFDEPFHMPQRLSLIDRLRAAKPIPRSGGLGEVAGGES